jgi:hypothetical protein
LNRKVYCAGTWDWSDEVTKALALLGAISKEDMAKHLAWVRRNQERDDAVNKLGEALRIAKENNPAVSVDPKKVMAMWDALDYYGQRKAKLWKYVPEGAVHKADPGSAGKT